MGLKLRDGFKSKPETRLKSDQNGIETSISQGIFDFTTRVKIRPKWD